MDNCSLCAWHYCLRSHIPIIWHKTMKTALALALALIALTGCKCHEVVTVTERIEVRDTVVVTPPARVDTVQTYVHGQPVIVERERVRIEARVDTVTRQLWLSAECKPDTVRIKGAVKYITRNETRTPVKRNRVNLWLIVGVVLGIIGYAGLAHYFGKKR